MLWVKFKSPFFSASDFIVFGYQDFRAERKWKAVGFCSGAIAGLVAITPGSGFVGTRG